MPLDDLVGGLFRIIGHLLFEFFTSIVGEILLKGPGYLILKWLYPKRYADPNKSSAEVLELFVGVMFWLFIAGLVYLVWRKIA